MPKSSVEKHLAAVVDRVALPEFSDIVCGQSELWATLVDAIRKQQPNDTLLSDTRYLEACEEFDRTASAEAGRLHGALVEYEEAQSAIRTEAAFLVGFALGRRLGGAR